MKKSSQGKILFKGIRSLFAEDGQSMVEFALVLPILVMLLLIPLDIYRYVSLQAKLNNAAVDGLNYVRYENIKGGTYEDAIKSAIDSEYGSSLDVSRLAFEKLEKSGSTTEDYTYYVYSSDKRSHSYQNQFDARPSNYEHCTITAQLGYELKPITFWGSLLMGRSCTVKSKEVSRDIYSGGYAAEP